MKRGTKLLVLLGILVLLALAVWLLPKLEQGGKTAKEEPVETDPPSAVLTIDKTAVTGMGWNYRGETLFFTRGETWQYPEDDNFSPNGEALDSLLDSVSAISTAKTISDPEALTAYGLAEPELAVTLTTDSGEKTLSFGSLSGTGEECYLENGDGKVYLVDPVLKEQFYLTLLDVIKLDDLPDLSGMTGLTVKTRDGDLHLQYVSGHWYVGNTLLDEERTQAFLDTVQGVSWLACVCYGADLLDLQVYGLDEPAGTVTITESGNDLLSLEFTEDGYARISGSDRIYDISTELCDALLYTTVPELLPDEVLSADWNSIKTLDITLDGEVYTAVKQGTDAETGAPSWDIQGLITDLAALRDTLGDMTGTYALGAKPERKLRLQIVVTEDSGDIQTLCFYPYDSLSCLVQRNGSSTVFITRDQLDELISAITVLVS